MTQPQQGPAHRAYPPHPSMPLPAVPQMPQQQWAPTAWQSIPAFVRFAIVIWSIGIVVGVFVGCILGLVAATNS